MSAVADHSVHSWRAVSASRRGSSHGPDVPNQDAVRCEQVSRPDGPDVWVAAVADGHGGARYVRSDVGARTAVDVAVDSVRQALDTAPDADLSAVLRAQVPRIVDAWRQAVKAHTDDHPFTPAEEARAGGDPRVGNGLTAYGATLLVALVGDHGVAVAQVGDGDALVRSHGFATRPVPGDARLVAGETTSLCLPSAAEDFRYAFLPASAEPDLVLLATDGYGNSFAQADWWQGLLIDVASFVERLGFQQLEEQLPDWLEESARVGGDDVSAVLVVRRPLAVQPPGSADPVPATPAVMPGPRTLELPHDDAVRHRAPSSRWRAPVVAAVAAVVSVLGVIAALLLLGPEAPESPADVPSDRSSTTPPGSDRTDEKKGPGKKGDRRGDRAPGGSTTPPESGPEQQPSTEPPDTGQVEPQKPVRESG